MQDEALSFEGPGDVCHKPVNTGSLEKSEVRVETNYSAISPGTEMLVYRGEVPEEMVVDTAIESLSGRFSYPLEYGYAAVGTVTALGQDVEESWLGKRVFGFEPHRTGFNATPEQLVPLPEWLSGEIATLIPTFETATNLVLDSAPLVGERVVVFGAGPIGLATISLLAEFPIDLIVAEPIETRRQLAKSVGADVAVTPRKAKTYFDQEEPVGADVAIEVSGEPSTLDDAIETIGYHGRIIVGSWYGTKRAPIDLGRSFHRDDITISASQVTTIAPDRRGRWNRDRRLETALSHLRRFDATAMISHRIAFEDAPRAYRLLDEDDNVVQVILTYDDEAVESDSR